MKKIILLLLIGLYAFADIAQVKTIKGDVKSKRAYDVTQLEVGDTLNNGDIIITGQDSSIGIIFNDGSRLTLGSKSRIVLEKYIFMPKEFKYQFELNMSKGKAMFESGEVGKYDPKSFKFKVPSGIIGIRGTKFYVEVE